MLDVPRSARLAAWGTAVLGGKALAAQAMQAVTRQDEAHTVSPADPDVALPGCPPGAGLADLLSALAEQGCTGMRVVLPAPGDARGLPGPACFNAAAVEAGECVLVEPGPRGGCWAAVPLVTAFGSPWEPGHLVDWRVHTVSPARVSDLGSVSEAERELRATLGEATAELARLDVARWRDDAAARIEGIRDGGLEGGVLPASAPPRCVRVLATAARVRAIVELASQDHGGAVSAYEAHRRAQALRGVDSVARRAMAAAVNGILEARA